MTRPRLSMPLSASVLAAAALLLGSAGPVSASCAPPAAIDDAVAQADLVVVGTVASLRSRDRVSTVKVEEVWKGDAGGTVEIFGGPEAENAATTVDRTWALGQRYLIVAIEPRAHGYEPTFGGRYESSTCSATQPYTAALAAHRPAGASPPAGDVPGGGPPAAAPGRHSAGSGPSATLVGVAAAALAALAAVALRAVVRRRRPTVVHAAE